MQNQKEDDYIDLEKLVGTFLDYKWWIAGSTLLFSLLGMLYALLAAPVYTANASIQVEGKNANGLFKDMSALFEQNSSASTEIAILKSRLVLGKSVEELNLTTTATPKFAVPFLSKGIATLSGNTPDIEVAHLEVFDSRYDNLILEIGVKPNSYLLYSEDNTQILEGVLNRKYVMDKLSIQVNLLSGEIGQRFNLSKRNPLLVIEDLSKRLSVIEQGKQTGVIEISLKGESPREIEKIIKSVSENYVLQNINRSSEEASKSLEFLQHRLPEVREKLAVSEEKLNEFLQDNGSVDLGLETKSVLDTLIQIEADLNALSIKETELSRKFTPKHPTYVALLEQRRLLEEERGRLNSQIGDLPDTQKEIIRLKRDLEVDQQIYIQLLNKVQELDIVKAGIGGNVRILDVSQVMPQPVGPKKMLIILIATALGGIIGCGIALLSFIAHRGIELASEVEELGLTVYASIPHAKGQISLKSDSAKQTLQNRVVKLLSEESPADLSVEALRSLRTGLHFAMLEASNNIVMLSGTSPEVGKSFIATNLANVISKAGKRVLLIDVDLRRSYLSHLLNVSNKRMGLVEYLSQSLDVEQVVQQTEYGFDVIVKGGHAPNPSELLAGRRFQDLLHWASLHYDIVLVDTPPILAVTDAAVVGRYVGTTLLIGRFEKTTLREVSLARQAFERAGVTIKGFILNSVKRKASNRYDYYQYEYK